MTPHLLARPQQKETKKYIRQPTICAALPRHFGFRSALPLFKGRCATPSTSKGVVVVAPSMASGAAGRSSGVVGRAQPVKAPKALHQRPERKMLISTRSPEGGMPMAGLEYLDAIHIEYRWIMMSYGCCGTFTLQFL